MTDRRKKIGRATAGRHLTGVSLATVLAFAAAPTLSQTVTSQSEFDDAVAAGIGQSGSVVIDINSPSPGDDLPITLNDTLALPGNAASFTLRFNSIGGTGFTGGFYIGDAGGTGSLTFGDNTAILINRDTHFNTLKVGRNGGDGTLIMTGGALTFSGAGTAGSFDIGRGADAVGLFEQSGGTVTMANDAFQVGIVGAQGTANISGGTFNAGTTVRIGNGTGGDGTVNVSGDATFAQASGDFYIGETGSTGVFTQSGNSTVSLLSPRIGRGGTGTYQLDGGTLTAGNLRLGETYSGGDGDGTFIQNGGQATFSNGIAFRWNNSNDASGAFIQNGGTTTISGGNINFGNATGTGTGSYTLGGTGILEVGGTGGLRGGKGDDEFIFAGGTLRVTSGLTTTGGFVTELADGTTSTIDTNGFDADWTNAFDGPGAFTKLGEGTFTFSGAGGTVAIGDSDDETVSTITEGTVEMFGRSLVVAGDLVIEEDGELIIDGGTGVTPQTQGPGLLRIGHGDSGRLFINGGDVLVRVTEVGGVPRFQIGTNTGANYTGGDAGTGYGEMSGGSIVFDNDPDNVNWGSFDIGRGTGATGTFLQTGGSVDMAGEAFQVGYDGGTGVYTMTGGTFELFEGSTIYIGGEDGSDGTLNLSGDAVFHQGTTTTTGTQLFVGGRLGGGAVGSPVGVINQSGNADVIIRTDNPVHIGYGGGTGTYNLSGGTLLFGGNEVRFGEGADSTGSFNQSGGEAEFEAGMRIAENATSTGTVTQTGGTLLLSGGQIIFGPGTSTYNLRDEGLLVIGPGAGATQFTGTGALNLGGGTIQAGQSFSSASAATLEADTVSTFNVVNDGESVTWSGVIGGAGGFDKDGEGTLTLTTANSFAGAVSILDGTLAITDEEGIGVGNDLSIAAPGAFDMSGVSPDGSTVEIGVLSGAGAIDLGNNRLETTIGAGVTTSFSGDITSDGNHWDGAYGNFVKLGAGTLVIDDATMTRGEFHVEDGTLALTGGDTSIDFLGIGSGSGNSAEMTITDGNLNIGAGFAVGHWNGDGTVNQSGGIVTVQANCPTSNCVALHIGNQGADGTYDISGGELRLVGGGHSIGRNTSQPASTGTLNISGDALVVLSPDDDPDFGSNGFLVIGDRDAGAAPHSEGVINQTGGILRIVDASTLWLAGYGPGTYNLDAGVLEIGGTSLQGSRNGGEYAFNLGGGTIRVIGADLDTSVDTTLVADTNSTFDTNGFDANWGGILTGDGGFTKTGEGTLFLDNAGNDYQGTTIVEEGTLAAGTPGAFVDSIAYEINGGILDVGSNGDLTMSSLNGDPGGVIDLGETDLQQQPSQFAANLTVDGGGVFGGSIIGEGGLIKEGEALLVLDGASSYTGGTQLIGGELRVGDDMALGAGSLLMGDATTLSFNDEVTLANWIHTDSAQTFTIDTRGFDGTLTGGITAIDVEMTKTGAGTLLLSGGPFVPNGPETPGLYDLDLTVIDEGTLLVDLDAVLDSDVDILAGATLGGNGTIIGDVSNAGTIGPGQSVGILDIVGNYAGGPLGSDLAMGNFEVDLTATSPVAGVDYDQLRISGTATGATTIYLFEPNPSGPPTVLAGGTAALGDIGEIELIQIGENEAEFTLGHRVVQGGREVVLDIRDVDNPDPGFFDTGLDFITVVGLAEGDIAAEVYGYAAATTAARQAGLAMLGNYVERRGLDGLLGDAPMSRVWARVAGAGYDSGDAGLDQDLWLGQAGIDLISTAEGVRAGIMAGYGRSEGRFDSASGRGDLSGDLGMVGVYGNWTDGTAYAEAVMQYGFGEWRMTPAGLGRSTFDTETFGLSIEGGAAMALSEDVSMLPWAQLAYQSIGFSGVDDPIGLDPDFENTDSLVLRGGVRAVAGFEGARLHGGIALAGELLGDAGVTVQGLQLDSDASSSWAELSAGVDLPLADGVALFAQFGYDRGLDGDLSVVRGHGGVRFGW